MHLRCSLRQLLLSRALGEEQKIEFSLECAGAVGHVQPALPLCTYLSASLCSAGSGLLQPRCLLGVSPATGGKGAQTQHGHVPQDCRGVCRLTGHATRLQQMHGLRSEHVGTAGSRLPKCCHCNGFGILAAPNWLCMVCVADVWEPGLCPLPPCPCLALPSNTTATNAAQGPSWTELEWCILAALFGLSHYGLDCLTMPAFTNDFQSGEAFSSGGAILSSPQHLYDDNIALCGWWEVLCCLASPQAKITTLVK